MMGLLTQYDTRNQKAPKAVYVSLKKISVCAHSEQGKDFQSWWLYEVASAVRIQNVKINPYHL